MADPEINAELRAEIVRLQNALAQYADPTMYMSIGHWLGRAAIDFDQGKLAMNTLGPAVQKIAIERVKAMMPAPIFSTAAPAFSDRGS